MGQKLEWVGFFFFFKLKRGSIQHVLDKWPKFIREAETDARE